MEWNYPLDYAVAFGKAIEALGKQIPKEPIRHMTGQGKFVGDILEHLCPKCSHKVYTKHRYCYKCGQAIDWSDKSDTDKS